MAVVYALAARAGRSRGRGADSSRVYLVGADAVVTGVLPAYVSPRDVALTRERAEELARAASPRRRAVRVEVEPDGALLRVVSVLPDERHSPS